jgi:hypothetical protein
MEFERGAGTPSERSLSDVRYETAGRIVFVEFHIGPNVVIMLAGTINARKEPRVPGA